MILEFIFLIIIRCNISIRLVILRKPYGINIFHSLFNDLCLVWEIFPEYKLKNIYDS